MAATREQKILFTALGFTAVILSGAPQDKQAQRALAIARLIENFCMSVMDGDAEAAPGRADILSGLIDDNRKNHDLLRETLSSLQQAFADDAETPAAAPADLVN